MCSNFLCTFLRNQSHLFVGWVGACLSWVSLIRATGESSVRRQGGARFSRNQSHLFVGWVGACFNRKNGFRCGRFDRFSPVNQTVLESHPETSKMTGNSEFPRFSAELPVNHRNPAEFRSETQPRISVQLSVSMSLKIGSLDKTLTVTLSVISVSFSAIQWHCQCSVSLGSGAALNLCVFN